VSWQNFIGYHFPFELAQPTKHSYSVTADVLAHKTCSAQYGAFRARKYEPATVPQLFWGTAIHQVLDMAHAHYGGLAGPRVRGSFPTDADIEEYFNDVENALRARQIGVMRNIRDQALELVKRFNRLEGPTLYPMVIDTECRLEADQGEYILQGTVDVIRLDNQDPPRVEIWDYKGTENPGRGSPQFRMFEYQMQVYAELYRRKTGVVPASVALYFLNELRGDPEPRIRPANAVARIQLEPALVDAAIADFTQTVREIETQKSTRNWIPPHAPDIKTCNGCDLRWKCSVRAREYGGYPSLLHP
jgi:CRISPR/Cas system-associated exonuclease Cas4 (RecB family)